MIISGVEICDMCGVPGRGLIEGLDNVTCGYCNESLFCTYCVIEPDWNMFRDWLDGTWMDGWEAI